MHACAYIYIYAYNRYICTCTCVYKFVREPRPDGPSARFQIYPRELPSPIHKPAHVLHSATGPYLDRYRNRCPRSRTLAHGLLASDAWWTKLTQGICAVKLKPGHRQCSPGISCKSGETPLSFRMVILMLPLCYPEPCSLRENLWLCSMSRHAHACVYTAGFISQVLPSFLAPGQALNRRWAISSFSSGAPNTELPNWNLLRQPPTHLLEA